MKYVDAIGTDRRLLENYCNAHNEISIGIEIANKLMSFLLANWMHFQYIDCLIPFPTNLFLPTAS